MSRQQRHKVSWADLSVFLVIYLIALAFSALAANNPFGIGVLVVTLLSGAAAVVFVIRSTDRK